VVVPQGNNMLQRSISLCHIVKMMWLKSIVQFAVSNSNMNVWEHTSQKDIISELTVMIQSLLRRPVAVRPLGRFKDCGKILSFFKIHEQLCSCQFYVRLTMCTHIDAVKIQGSFAGDKKAGFVLYVTKRKNPVQFPVLNTQEDGTQIYEYFMIRLFLNERQIYVNRTTGHCPDCISCKMAQLQASTKEELLADPRRNYLLDVAGS
jgi:hypothetical protein